MTPGCVAAECGHDPNVSSRWSNTTRVGGQTMIDHITITFIIIFVITILVRPRPEGLQPLVKQHTGQIISL